MALVLSRSEGESLLFTTPEGVVIEVKVKRIHGTPDGVVARLVIEAPREVTVLRRELVKPA